MSPKQRTRIGFVAYSLEPGLGGIPRVARLMERTLAEYRDRDIEFDSLALSPLQSGKSRLSRWLAYSRMLIKHRILALGCTHFVYDSCQMAQLHSRPWSLAAPALTFIHGIEVWERAQPRYLKACHNSKVLTSNSDFTRRQADRLHGNFLRAGVCWLATEQENLPSDYRKAECPTVLIVSRIDRGEGYKGHLELVEAWPRVLRSIPNAKLRVIGRGNGLDALQQRAIQLNCQDHIVFDGFVAEEKLEECYGSSHVFAMPSRGEGFGIVYIEAMRCGLPVIVSKHDAGQEVIVDGETGYAVDLDVQDELASRIIELLSSPGQAMTMGQAGRRRWQQHFTPSQFVQRFRTSIGRLLECHTHVDTTTSETAGAS